MKSKFGQNQNQNQRAVYTPVPVPGGKNLKFAPRAQISKCLGLGWGFAEVLWSGWDNLTLGAQKCMIFSRLALFGNGHPEVHDIFWADTFGETRPANPSSYANFQKDVLLSS